MSEIKGGRMSGKSYLDEEDRIESPLEALQDLSKLVFIYGGVEQYKIIKKALRALEIIKETPEFACYVKNYDNAYEMVSDVKGFRVNNSVEELQEMFDLLKEVLL